MTIIYSYDESSVLFSKLASVYPWIRIVYISSLGSKSPRRVELYCLMEAFRILTSFSMAFEDIIWVIWAFKNLTFGRVLVTTTKICPQTWEKSLSAIFEYVYVGWPTEIVSQFFVYHKSIELKFISFAWGFSLYLDEFSLSFCTKSRIPEPRVSSTRVPTMTIKFPSLFLN